MPIGRPIRPRPMSPIRFAAGFKRSLLDDCWYATPGFQRFVKRRARGPIVAELRVERGRPGTVDKSQAVLVLRGRDRRPEAPAAAAVAAALRGLSFDLAGPGPSLVVREPPGAAAASTPAPAFGFSMMRTRH